MTPGERRLSISSGNLQLEASLHEGADDLAALVLHPHPRYGGDMDNHAVVGLCAALATLGATTLRFNFRGTGRSEGAFDGGRGEADDARAAWSELRTLRPRARIVLAGYSFGAVVAATIASEVSLAALVLISPPVGMAPLPTPPTDIPVLLVTGDRDAIAPIEALRRYGNETATIQVAEGADHAWWPGSDALCESVRAFVGALPS